MGNATKQMYRQLFPGYIFVQFLLDTHGWHVINSTRGVLRLIVSDIQHQRPLPSSFMAELMARCDEKGVLGPPESLAEGDHIRVVAGPFANLVTVVEQMNKDQRIEALIDLMGRAVRTTLPFNAVERIEKPV